MEEKNVKNIIDQLEGLLDEYMIKKAPFNLPLGVKEFIVTVSPYLVIIFAILALPMILGAIGLSTMATPLMMMGGFRQGLGWGFGMIISFTASIIAVIIQLFAIQGLFKRTKKAWKLVFYASIVSLVGGILSVHGFIGAIIGAIIGWYIIFQVKDFYKN